MYVATDLGRETLASAIAAASQGPAALLHAVDDLPAPIYLTDAEGLVTYFNRACIGFTGRQPAVGKDRWCVTWKLFTDAGEFLPHDQCPMAMAIRERRSVRGMTAIAERPDGVRVDFIPFPTPILGPNGELLGAVNMLIDITELRQAADLRAQAARARRLAWSCTDQLTIETLTAMAGECEVKAAQLEAWAASPYLRLSNCV